MSNKYKDIIDLPRHISKTRKPMAREKRAAQFAPFAALTGHDEQVKETSSCRVEKKIPTQSYREGLNRKIKYIIENSKDISSVMVRYFVKETSSKGVYFDYTGTVIGVDRRSEELLFEDHKKIKINDIYEISIEKR